MYHKFEPGQRIELSPAGERILLPKWRNKTKTGTVVTIVTQSGDIITVQRDGLKQWQNEHASYFQPSETPAPNEIIRPFALKRPRYDKSGYACPVCEHKLRLNVKRRDASKWYICPNDEHEVIQGKNGLEREKGAIHPNGIKVWSEYEIANHPTPNKANEGDGLKLGSMSQD